MPELLPIQDDDQFENFCCEVARDWFGDFAAQRYGRSGQRQRGIDISAINRRLAAPRKVVIQCKYQHDPGRDSSRYLMRELEGDLDAALAHHQFEIFVFATTAETCARLQDKAAELASLHGREVVIWSWNFLEQAVALHPRLQRLYARGRIGGGVRLLDPDFIQDLARRPANPFQFFTAKVDGDWQWLGVHHGLAAPRSCQEEIEARLDALFAKTYLDKKVAAVVCGEGGSGKSTVLRQIALHQASQGTASWWVENMENFLQHDAISIQENRQLRCLVVIEDWYRNMRGDSAATFFTWLKEQSHVLVLIGDRTFQASVYGEHCYHGARVQLLPSENWQIIEHISSSSADYRDIFSRLDVQPNLLDMGSIFMLLFIAATLLNERGQHPDIDIHDGALTAFQKIIGKKILVLESADHSRGLGRAMVLLAMIYTSAAMRYLPVPEELFVNAAAFLGNNDQLLEVIDEEGYPSEVLAILHRGPLVSSRVAASFFRIDFNHDVLAEQGVIHAHEQYEHLASRLPVKSRELIQLLEALIPTTAPNGLLILWRWLVLEGHLRDRERMMSLLERILLRAPETIGFGMFIAALQALPTEEQKWAVCETVLQQPQFFAWAIAPAALNHAHDETARATAEQILSDPGFFMTLPDSVVLVALDKVDAESALRAAEQICSSASFTGEMSATVAVKALSLLGWEQSHSECRRLLSQPDFFSTWPSLVVIKVLSLADRQDVLAACARILACDDFYQALPWQTVVAMLQKADKQSSRQAAQRILRGNSFYIDSRTQVVVTALQKADHQSAAAAASQVLAHQNFYIDLPDQVVVTALQKADQQSAESAARQVLSHQDFYIELPDQVVVTALLKADRQSAESAASQVLSHQNFHIDLPDQVVVTALKVADPQARAEGARKILSHHAFPAGLPDQQVLVQALKSADDDDARDASAVLLSLPDFLRALPTEVVITALKKAEPTRAHTAAATILSQVLSDAGPLPSVADHAVSAALRYGKPGELMVNAARHVIETCHARLGQEAPFQRFTAPTLGNAFRALLSSGGAEDAGLITAVIDDINDWVDHGHGRNRLHSYGSWQRLYYELLSLPLYDSDTHWAKLRSALNQYGVYQSRQVKTTIARVLTCALEHPEVGLTSPEFRLASERILRQCVKDIEHQIDTQGAVDSFQHVLCALRHPALAETARRARAELLGLCSRKPSLRDSDFRRELEQMAGNSSPALARPKRRTT